MSGPELAWTGAIVLMVAVVAVRGALTERLAAAIVVAGSAASAVVRILSAAGDPLMRGPQNLLLGVDAIVATGLIWLALRSPKRWPLFAAGFMVAELVIHIARLLAPVAAPRAYFIGMAIFSYLVVAAIIWGGLTARRTRPG